MHKFVMIRIALWVMNFTNMMSPLRYIVNRVNTT